jgi:hypothetical protein
MDVIEHLAITRIGLGQALHEIDELTGHRIPWKPLDLSEICCR